MKKLPCEMHVYAPDAVWVVLGANGEVKSAFAFDADPYDYDLEPGECFVKFVLDETQRPLPYIRPGGDGP